MVHTQLHTQRQCLSHVRHIEDIVAQVGTLMSGHMRREGHYYVGAYVQE